jgi:nitrous oxidase accessory protein
VSATGVTLERLAIADVLYGVFAERADGLVVRDVRLSGRVEPGAGADVSMESSAGNGVHLWYTAHALVERCDVSRFMDGIYLSFAERAVIRSSVVHENGRYGLHTMYNQVNELEGNRFTQNVAGCALMFSNGLSVRGNAFLENRGPRTYGLLLKDCSGGRFENNRLVDNTIAVFMDNSNRNTFRGNLIQDNGWGVLLYSSCAKNEFAANDFVNNDYPVALDMRRTDNRFDDGSRGNFWSDAPVHDLDGDGAGDAPHSPVSAYAFLSKREPDLSLLAKSPAVAALSMAERAFPEMRPSDALDRFPRTRPAGHRGRGERAGDAPPRPAWPAAAAFAALAAGGGLAMRRGGRA